MLPVRISEEVCVKENIYYKFIFLDVLEEMTIHINNIPFCRIGSIQKIIRILFEIEQQTRFEIIFVGSFVKFNRNQFGGKINLYLK